MIWPIRKPLTRFVSNQWLPIIGIVAFSIAVAFVGHRAYVAGYERGSAAIQKQLDRERQANAEAMAKSQENARRLMDEYRKVQQSRQAELESRLVSATEHGVSLARRVQLYQDRYGTCQRALAGATAGAAGPTGEPGNSEAVTDAVEQHYAACSRDAERLGMWQQWWAEVSAVR